MPRAVWSGTLQFVLISFPVKLYKATDDKGVNFKSIHSECGNPISVKKWCNTCGREITGEDIDKGYEIAKGQYVLFTEEEIDSALPENAKTIKIEKAVHVDQIPSIAYEGSYFLSPDKGGEHVYGLMYHALKAKPKVLIGRFVMRNKEHLVAIRTYNNGLLLNLLHFSIDVRNIEEVVYIKEKEIDQKEVNLAISLLDYLTGSFTDINQKDRYREYIENMVEMKAKGQVITVTAKEPIAQVSIIDGLQKSIDILAKGGRMAGSEGNTDIVAVGETFQLIQPKPKEMKPKGIKQELDKMYGVTEEEIDKLILEQKIEDEEDRVKALKEIQKCSSFEDYVKTHDKEFEGICVSEDCQSISISAETYPRIQLPLLKKIGIVTQHFNIPVYIEPSGKKIERKREKEKFEEIGK